MTLSAKEGLIVLIKHWAMFTNFRQKASMILSHFTKKKF